MNSNPAPDNKGNGGALVESSSINANPRSAAGDPPPPRRRRRPSAGRILAWTFMILVVMVTLFPFYWMLRTALSTLSLIHI